MSARVLAVLGGSFDPPHLGHVMLPTWLLAQGSADRVLVAPCWEHALGKQSAPFDERLLWTRIAMQCHGPRVMVSDVERSLADARARAGIERPSYSLELLERVADEHPGERVRLVVGSDVIDSGETARWHRWDEIDRRFAPIVVPRGTVAADGTTTREGAVPAMSSTQIRTWLATPTPEARRELARCLPAAVLAAVSSPRSLVWLVGSGHVATQMRPFLRARGMSVVNVAARELVRAPQAATAALPKGDALAAVIVAVADPYLPSVAQALARATLPRTVPVLHAAGRLVARDDAALGALAREGRPVGTLHPICALRRERTDSELERASFGVEGDPPARAIARALVHPRPLLDLSRLDAEARVTYHAACSLVANHQAALVAASADAMNSAGVGGEVDLAIHALLDSAVQCLHALGIPAGISGPLVRGDQAAVDAHLAALHPDARALYHALATALRPLIAPPS